MLPLKGQTQSSQQTQPPPDSRTINWAQGPELDGAVGSYLHSAPPNTPFTQGAEEEIKGHPETSASPRPGVWKVSTMVWTPLLLLALLALCPGEHRC